MTSQTLLWALLCLWVAFTLAEDKIPLPSKLKPVCYEEGKQWLNSEATIKYSYESLFVHGVTQLSDTYSAVASSVMILNSLGVRPPNDTSYGYPYFNQANFFSSSVKKIVNETIVSDRGFTLEELGAALTTWERGYYGKGDEKPKKFFIVEDVVHADTVDEDTFRQQARNHVALPNARVIINFSREALGQGLTGGHMSVLLAFNLEEDAFLVFDVARYNFDCPTYWVPTKSLFNAMLTEDSESQQMRGYILLDDPDGHHDVNVHVKKDPQRPQGYVVAFVILGALFYVGVTCVAIAFIAAAFFTIARGRRSRPMEIEA